MAPGSPRVPQASHGTPGYPQESPRVPPGPPGGSDPTPNRPQKYQDMVFRAVFWCLLSLDGRWGWVICIFFDFGGTVGRFFSGFWGNLISSLGNRPVRIGPTVGQPIFLLGWLEAGQLQVTPVLQP